MARFVEQGVLGLATLLLARWLGVEGFAPVATLLVVNTFAIVASDYGLGMAIMAAPQGSVPPSRLRWVRGVNLALAVVGVVAGALMGGDGGTVLALAGVTWLLAGEAYVRKSALLRLGSGRRVAAIEIAASVTFGIGVVAVPAAPEHGLVVVGATLVAKHLLEVVASRGWARVLGEAGTTQSISIWFSQLLAYAIANVDFLVVGALVSSAAFSVYALAFRVASAATSQIAYAIGRVSVVDLGAAEDLDAKRAVYDRRMRMLFGAGLLAGGATAAVAPLLPAVLGSSWEPAVWVVVVLAVGIPWRMALGLTGVLMVSEQRASPLARWEGARLVGSTGAMLLGVLGGFGTFVAAVTVVAIVSTVVFEDRATRLAGLRPWALSRWLALPAVVCAVVASRAIPDL